MKTMIRVNSRTLGGSGSKTLRSMEDHGKRNDKTSKKRRVRDVEALVYNTLNLRQAYDAHMIGVRTNTSMKRPVLHAIIKFPNELKVDASNDAGRVPDPKALVLLLAPKATALPKDVAVAHPSLDSFDALLGASA